MKPNFKDIDIKSSQKLATSASEWEKANHIEKNWMTPELIPVKPVYTEEDIQNMEHLNYVSGIPPYLRGPYSAMYPLRPWTIRQYAGFSTAGVQRVLPPQPGSRAKGTFRGVRLGHPQRIRL